MAETTAREARDGLRSRVEARLAGSGAGAWLGEQASTDLEEVRGLLPKLHRQVGRRPLISAFAERARATVPGVWGAVPVGSWTLAQAAAALLLAEAADAAPDPYPALFRVYDLGDTDSRVAALRALNFVRAGAPGPGLELVLDAGRTYLTPLLEAAWCGNPFSAEHLSDHDYRKAVLKAFFCDVPVEGFLRLEERADAELAQSLCDYIDERLAAGRAVPRAIWALAAFYPRAGLVARLIGNLEHPDAAERLAAARALANAQDPRAHSFVLERAEREADPDVLAALERARARIEAADGAA